MNTLRYCAVPLITVDPYFSIWSMGDKLYDDVTKHWTGARNPMSAGVFIDGEYYSLMGQPQHNSDRYAMAYRLMKHVEQKSVKVTPTSTKYVFENEFVNVELLFTSPLVLDRIDIMTRPVAYIEYKIEVVDGIEHDIEFYFDISTECAVDSYYSSVKVEKTINSVYFGKCDQIPLSKNEDSMCMDWGYIHVSEPSATLIDGTTKRSREHKEIEYGKEYRTFEVYPYVTVKKKDRHGVITLGYDDVYSVEFLGKQIEPYYKKYFTGFDAMFEVAINEYDDIKRICMEFDERVMSEAKKVSERYEEIISLAYRQAVSAHKLVYDDDGNDMFFSKECHSNGCMATLDCTYESAPIFYKYNPDIIFAMLRPIAKYAVSGEWPFEFIPHDVGKYPNGNGQFYGATDGKQNKDMQMPLEECGNILICAAAAVYYGAKDLSFLTEYKSLMKKTVDYLVEKGFDPESQICTDDFTGKFAHSCNLSVKAILGIAAYGRLYDDEEYMNIAKAYAKKWEKESIGKHGSSRLAFDIEDSWSLKYNMVWDKLLKFNLFSSDIFENEVKTYEKHMNKYGVPLDPREEYTINIWVMWTTVMTNNEEYRTKAIGALYDFINETSDRVPMTDWHCTTINRRMDFQNRSVVGGLFINLLPESDRQ